jgi:choline dehydrogenase-like flavoprotein
VAKAGKEIILSAGTVGTPHLLMHSGIGDKRALQALGIPTLLDLPSVGQSIRTFKHLRRSNFEQKEPTSQTTLWSAFLGW